MSEEVGAKRWYAVHTYSGYENKVKKNLEKRVESMNMTEQIFRVVIPEEEETQVKDGKAKKQLKKTFPGYVLVELVMTDESWYVVRNTKGVTGFVGPGSKPVPLSEDEVKAMGIDTTDPKVVNSDIDFEIGDTVKVSQGPFSGQIGNIEEIDLENREVKVCINAFGKRTLFVIELEGIEKI